MVLYTYRGHVPKVKAQVSAMAMNGSGIRDTARGLKISPTTVIEELQKKPSLGVHESEHFRQKLRKHFRSLNLTVYGLKATFQEALLLNVAMSSASNALPSRDTDLLHDYILSL